MLLHVWRCCFLLYLAESSAVQTLQVQAHHFCYYKTYGILGSTSRSRTSHLGRTRRGGCSASSARTQTQLAASTTSFFYTCQNAALAHVSPTSERAR